MGVALRSSAPVAGVAAEPAPSREESAALVKQAGATARTKNA
jgi:hypothetical protein